jgi:hypothetical protein
VLAGPDLSPIALAMLLGLIAWAAVIWPVRQKKSPGNFHRRGFL